MTTVQPIQLNNEQDCTPDKSEIVVGQPIVVADIGGGEEDHGIVPNEWEKFLAGEECGCCCNAACRMLGCPDKQIGCRPYKTPSCCSCWTFFGIGWFFMLLFIMKIMQEGDALFSEDAGTLKDDLDVKHYYGFVAGQRSLAKGCGSNEMQEESVCTADVKCKWKKGRGEDGKDTCTTAEICPRPPPRPKEGFLSFVVAVYEAKGDDGNILSDEVLQGIAKYESAMLSNANGAEDKSGPSPWTDRCMRKYKDADHTIVGDSTCAPPSSMMNLFSITDATRQTIKEQVEAGYGPPGAAAFSCMCGFQDVLCDMCNTDGTLKGWNANDATWDYNQLGTEHCLRPLLQQMGGRRLDDVKEWMNTTASERRLDSSDICSGSRSVSANDFGAYLQAVCQSKPSCQWDGPELSFACSSSGYSQATSNPGGLVSGAAKEKMINEMCNQENKNYVGFRRSIFDAKFDCAAKKGKYAKSTFFIGLDDPDKAEEEKDALLADYIQGPSGWYAKEQELEREIEGDGKLRIMLFAEPLIRTQFLALLYQDSFLSLAALVIVWAYMWWTLESLFLATCGIFEILFSVPVAMSLWTVIMQQKIQFLQMLVIYMILGIGADDVFIAYDAYMQARWTGGVQKADRVTQFAWAYRRSFSAMAVTTMTTCGSFVIGITIPLPAVRDFCVFAAVVVFVDFMFCISFFCSAMVVNEKFFKGKGGCCFGKVNDAGKCLGPGMCFGGCRALCTGCGNTWAICPKPTPPDAEPELKALEQFCSGPFHQFLAGVGGKVFVVFWTVLVIASIVVCGTSLRTAEKAPPFGREHIDLTRGLEVLTQEFPNFQQPKSYAFWGLHAEEPVEYGNKEADNEPVYADTASALSSEAGQLELLALCRQADRGDDSKKTRCESNLCVVQGDAIKQQCLRDESIWKTYGYYTPADALCQPGRYCFMEEFARFWAYTSDGCYTKTNSLNCVGVSPSGVCKWDSDDNICYTTKTEHDYPGLPQSEFLSKLGGADFKAYLERRSDVMTTLQREYEVTLYEEMTGFTVNSASTSITFAYIGWNATYANQNTVEIANEWYDRWQEFFAEQTGTIGGIQTMELYTFRAAQNEMVKGAILGIVCSLLVAFLILVLATMNWWTAALGLLNICAEVCVFLGLLPVIGWSLGEYECIFMIATVGLSVDYTVHLLHAYNHSHAEDRISRGKAAMGEMGMSVLNSAITTLLAAFILFFCGFYFFFQFGAFLFIVIFVSIIMSMTFLMPIIMMIGPERDQGRLAPIYRRITGKGS